MQASERTPKSQREEASRRREIHPRPRKLKNHPFRCALACVAETNTLRRLPARNKDVMPLEAPPQSLTEKVNIRVTLKMRVAIGRHCRREDIGEMDMMRYLLEAGLMVAEKRGIAGVMAERSEFLSGEYPPGTRPGRPAKRVNGRRA